MNFFKNIFRRKTIGDMLAGVSQDGQGLRRVLTARDLVLLGIGGIIGAGIFATVGTATVGDTVRPGAGPAIVISFIITGVACGFTALCYAELSSMVPVSGSAYTYVYLTMGEFIAWIIGWDLMLEYAIGNVAIAISWAGYFKELLRGFGITIPAWLVTDYRSALHGDTIYSAAQLLMNGSAIDHIETFTSAGAYIAEQVASGSTLEKIAAGFRNAHDAIAGSPKLFGMPIIFNLPAVCIVALVTTVLYRGIRESARFNTIMVILKLMVLAFFVLVGCFYVKPENWTPFMPNGWSGIQAGAAIVFFAYLGFDAVSTVAEETINPRRDLPIGIIGSLVICTVIYVVVAAVLTGMIPLTAFNQSNKAEPLTVAMNFHRLDWAAGFIALGSVVAHTAVLIVQQTGQTRIFFSMGRDGLLPRSFAKVHPRFRTPHVNIMVTGVFVGFFAAFTSIDEMVDLTNVGTLFAFMLVCVGVIILRKLEPDRERGFRVPFVQGIALAGIVMCVYLMAGLPAVTFIRFFIWLAVGSAFYFSYGYWNSRRRHGTVVMPPDDLSDH
ncbi:MAG TPA: amino acid permease [Spirochaetota bacterium]|nr:amino acid permease [Spirochaetota bacterium]HPC40486.1 amino acid permease [Spirochaetota bacterium]HPL18552.1 amino acid permease [Spirochaetota bacterium]HQF06553.1 amino acid permease [Spirochaetota bacterium]HQH96044.1 amino acid permease [Spirochaetota bacterium]